MDGIFGVGPLELIVIVVLALVILGPERLPGTIREIVKFMRQVRAIGTELTSQFTEELHLLDDFNPKKILEEVAGLDEDDTDIKDMLGISKDDLTLDASGKKKPAAKTPAKTGAAKSSAASANVPKTTPHQNKAKIKKSKPALGETDPEETAMVDAVSEKETPDASGDSNLADNNDSSADSATKSGTVSSTGSSKPESESEGGDEEQVVENSIAPPSMSNAQSLVAGKAGSTITRSTSKATSNAVGNSEEDEPEVADITVSTTKNTEPVTEGVEAVKDTVESTKEV